MWNVPSENSGRRRQHPSLEMQLGGQQGEATALQGCHSVLLQPQPAADYSQGHGVQYLVPTACGPGLSDHYHVLPQRAVQEVRTRPVQALRRHFWKCGLYGPYDPCNGHSCDRLQKIITVNDWNPWHVPWTASEHAAVVFGGDFCMDP